MKSLKPIVYFSLFQYPLTKEEIFAYSQADSISKIGRELKKLEAKELLQKKEEFYIYGTDTSIVERRKKGNKTAKEMLPKAIKNGKFIAKFPYISCVCISGSLSKNYYDENGDFDYFIITQPNRLWIARTLLILYKKVFLLNSKKHFCINYFISSDQLEIAEKNSFTAIELLTLLPIAGSKTYAAFLKQNKWVHSYFPNLKARELENSSIKNNSFRTIIEYLLNNKLGVFLDTYLKKITLARWNKKFNYLSNEEFAIALKSTKNVSKHHPQNYQKKVLEKLQEQLEIAEAKISK